VVNHTRFKNFFNSLNFILFVCVLYVENGNKIRSGIMTKIKVLSLINKDSRLLALFSGMLIDGILLIALVVYIGTCFI